MLEPMLRVYKQFSAAEKVLVWTVPILGLLAVVFLADGVTALLEFLLVPALTGLVVGLVVSWMWWRYLLSRRPNVRICPIVLRGPKVTEAVKVIEAEEVTELDEVTEPDKTVYRIKLINYGKSQVIDLKAKAEIHERRKMRWRLVRSLKLQYDGAIPAMGTEADYGNVIKAPSPIQYSLILNENNIEAELKNDDRRLVFTLSAKDALSGTAVVQREFYTQKEIQEGDFATGFKCEKAESSF